MSYDELFAHLLEKRTILLAGHIELEKQEDIAMAVVLLNSQAASPIKFLLDSAGGSAQHSFMICDSIVHSVAPVNGLIMGKAHSGGFLVCQAFKKRIAYPHATFLLHGPGLDGLRSDQRDLSDQIKFREKLHQEMLEMVARRTGQPMEKLLAWSKEERYFNAKEALELDFIDEIAEPPGNDPA